MALLEAKERAAAAAAAAAVVITPAPMSATPLSLPMVNVAMDLTSNATTPAPLHVGDEDTIMDVEDEDNEPQSGDPDRHPELSWLPAVPPRREVLTLAARHHICFSFVAHFFSCSLWWPRQTTWCNFRRRRRRPLDGSQLPLR